MMDSFTRSKPFSSFRGPRIFSKVQSVNSQGCSSPYCLSFEEVSRRRIKIGKSFSQDVTTNRDISRPYLHFKTPQKLKLICDHVIMWSKKEETFTDLLSGKGLLQHCHRHQSGNLFRQILDTVPERRSKGVSWKWLVSFLLLCYYFYPENIEKQFHSICKKYRGPSEDSSFFLPSELHSNFRFVYPEKKGAESPISETSKIRTGRPATGKAHNAPQSPPPKEGPKVCIRPAFLTQTNHNPITWKDDATKL